MGSHSRRKITQCVDCGRPGTEADPLSVRGLHEACAIERMTKSARQLVAKEGPYYDEWLRSMREASRRLVEQFGG